MTNARTDELSPRDDRLGALRSEHGTRPRPAMKWILLSAAPGVFLAAILGFVVGRGEVALKAKLALLACAAGPLALAGFLYWNRRRHAHDRIRTFDLGLSIRRAGLHDTCRWDEIVGIHRSEWTACGRTEPTLRLVLREGRTVMLGSGPAAEVVDMGRLAEDVEGEFYRRSLGPTVSRFLNGETLDLGVFSASQKGLQLRRRCVPWDEVGGFRKHVFLTNGSGDMKLHVLKPGGAGDWAEVPLAQVVNLEVLLAVWQLMAEQNARPSASPA